MKGGSVVLLTLALASLLASAGCGGGGESTAPPPGPEMRQATVGPFVIQTTTSAPVDVQSITHTDGVAFVALSTSGVINWLGTIEPMERLLYERDRQIYRADFFGDNAKCLTNRADGAYNPQWSPDGESIAYNTGAPSSDIIIMDEDGLNERRLTDTPGYTDRYPTFSPDGRWVAFASTMGGPMDIVKMLVDGSATEWITDGRGGMIYHLEWSPTSNEILFDDTSEIRRVDAEDGTETRVTDDAGWDVTPSWRPDGDAITYAHYVSHAVRFEVVTASREGTHRVTFASSRLNDVEPTYTADGEWIFFRSHRTGVDELHAKQTRAPHRVIRIAGTTNALDPDLGSPSPTHARTLIGPSGSDHGFDPVHSHAIAAVLVFDEEGYVNFVRVGVPSDRGSDLALTPLDQSGDRVVGVVCSCPDMYYVEQDEGMGKEPTIWDLSRSTSRSIILYFNAATGELVAVLDLDENNAAVSTASMTNAITHEATGASITVRGSFRAVYGPVGETVAEGEIGAVEIDADRGVVRAF